jgi:prevent-host-death family protein
MKPVSHRGADDARAHLPELIAAARAGESTIITKHGVPVAALVPVSVLAAHAPQTSLLALAGSGRGIWGKDSRTTLDRLRAEWDR